MAFFSGFEASVALYFGQSPGEVANRLNRGIAAGFKFGLPSGLIVATILSF